MRSIKANLLISIGIIVVIFSIILLYRTYTLVNANIENLTNQQLSLTLNFALGIREYVAEKVRPITLNLVGEGEFIPSTMSTSYVARNIFEKVRKEFPDYIIKFSADNPRNPVNLAGPAEINMIKYFNDNPREKIWTGEIAIGDKQYFARFSAMRMDNSCLQCHGDPADAPAQLIEIYGSTAGFHLPLGKVVGLDTIAIPKDIVTEKLWNETIQNFAVTGVALFLLCASLFFVFKYVITDRLSKITEHFLHTEGQDEAIEIETIEIKGQDEINTLTNSFNKLAGKLNDTYTNLKQEIEERKKAEEALRESEERYRELVENAVIGFYQVEEQGKFRVINQKMAEIFGYSSSKEFLKDFDNVTKLYAHPEERPKILQEIKERGHIERKEVEFKGKNSKSVWIKLNTRVTADRDGEIVYEGLMEDITERKQMEEKHKRLEDKLQQAYKMEAIGTLAGGIAHDFNNILTPIIVQTELALMDVPSDSDIKFNLQEVMKAGLRAKDLVKQILTFSRQSEQQPVPLKLSPIIKEATKLLRSSLPTTIEIRLNLPKSTDTVIADPTQIHQVLMNLCTNAAHAMRETGGILEISLSEVEVDSDFAAKHTDMEPGPYINLAVSDTGHGIAPDVIDRIFEPFFTTKDRSEGTGMGLAVVHGIIKSYGGEITIESELGKGTVFNVFLPRIKTDVSEETEPDVQLLTGNERVLVVDDEKDMVNTLSKMLNKLGYQVVVKTNSQEALKVFEAESDRFDLVITDQTMPKITGMELAKIFMQIRSDIPIILCTGFSERVNEESAKAMGISEFVMKPVVMRDIAKTIRQVLEDKK